jgi:hypothetical protein
MDLLNLSLVRSGAGSANLSVRVLGVTLDTGQQDTNAAISSFARLPRGWDFGRGGPIPEKTLALARAWNSFLQSCGFSEIEAFPGEAEVLLAVSDNDHYFELIIESDHTISIAYDFQRRQVFYRVRMSEQKALETLAEIMGRKWSASGYFTRVDTMSASTNLHALRFGTLPTMDVYLSWTGIAYNQPVNPSGHILGGTTSDTPAWYGSPPFFGNLMQPQSFRRVIT